MLCRLPASHHVGTHRPQSSRAVALRSAPHRVSAPSPRRQTLLARAAEEATAEAVSDEEPTPQNLTPLERAKRLLQGDGDLDTVELETCLAGLEEEMSELRSSLSAAEARTAQLDSAAATARDQLLRLNADFDNFRRRTTEEKRALQDDVRADVIKELLPLVDNFELARTQVKAETEAEQKINNSYQSLYKQMVDMMRTLGVEPVPTTGTPFDPAIHDAIMREPNDQVPDGTVLKEFRKGFALKGKLIRPAMVQVSVNDGPTASSEE